MHQIAVCSKIDESVKYSTSIPSLSLVGATLRTMQHDSTAPDICTSAQHPQTHPHLQAQVKEISQILRRPRHHSSRIPIDSLQNLPQPSMAVVLLIPLILVIAHPLARPLPILLDRLLKTESNEMVDVESSGRQPRSPGSLHLENDRGWDVRVGGRLGGRDDLHAFGAAALHHNGDSPPLAGHFEPCVAV